MRTPLVVEWLIVCDSTAEGMDLIPGQGTKIPAKTNKNPWAVSKYTGE